MKLPALKRIVKENFEEKDQDLVDKIGYPFNTALESILQCLSKGINFDNLAWQFKEMTFTVGSDGTFGTDASFKSEVKGKILGLQVIYVANLTNPNDTLTTSPFAQYSINDNLITINNIIGLKASNKYTVRLIVYC